MVVGLTSGRTCLYPNKLGRVVLMALEELLGRSGVHQALAIAGLSHLIDNFPPQNSDLAFPSDHLPAIHQSLDALFGQRGGRGVALRAGRACFKYGIAEFAPGLISTPAFKCLPLNKKMEVGSRALLELIEQYGETVVKVIEEKDAMTWELTHCPVCSGRQSDAPCCQLLVGLLQESLFWLSGGKNYLVEEQACIASGAPACSFRIARSPLD